MPETLQTTTTFSIEGYRITEYKGLVRGIVVRSPTIGQGFLGGLKQIIGGQIGAYTEMCEQTREQAYELLLQHARALRANAVVGVRYESSEVGRQGSATEVLCYGTAVVIPRSQCGEACRPASASSSPLLWACCFAIPPSRPTARSCRRLP